MPPVVLFFRFFVVCFRSAVYPNSLVLAFVIIMIGYFDTVPLSSLVKKKMILSPLVRNMSCT